MRIQRVRCWLYLVILREQEAPLRISALSVTLACHWALRSHRALSTLYPCPLAPWRLWPNFWPWNEKRFNILISKKREWVWEKTHLVLVPPVLQVLGRVFQELILLLPLVKKIQETRKRKVDLRIRQWCAHVGCTSGAAFRRRAHSLEDDWMKHSPYDLDQCYTTQVAIVGNNQNECSPQATSPQ